MSPVADNMSSGNSSPVTTRDSTDSYIPGTFEGPEKTMEICFIPGIGEKEGLRKLSREQLDTLCREAKCTILSCVSNAHMDAYVLSESSLFVYKDRYIMKTCGTTTLLHCLDSLLKFADELQMELMWVGYSRKNLLFPTQQAWPHSNFGDEIEFLNSHKLLQARLNGVAHILGPVTGDHWFVYVAENPPHMAALVESHERERLRKSHATVKLPKSRDSATPSIPKNNSTGTLHASSDLNSRLLTMEGVTVNMMMFDLDPAIAKLFYQSGDPNSPYKDEKDINCAEIGKRMTRESGIKHLVPGATIDETSFSPCGYSMNAILHDAYSTIHVTPEHECSYASFETNTLLHSYSPLVRNALDTFRPQRFVLTMFADQDAYDNLHQVPTNCREFFIPKVGTYRRTTVSTTNIGNESDLHCTMACYSLVSEKKEVPVLKPKAIGKSSSVNGISSMLINRRKEDEGQVSFMLTGHRVRSNTVDMTSDRLPLHAIL